MYSPARYKARHKIERAYQRKYHNKNRDKVNKRRRELYQQNLKQVRAYKRENAAKRIRFWKDQVIKMYGGRCQCNGCDITHRDFLTVEHVKGGGRKHREKIGGGIIFYRWLVKLGRPRKNFLLFCYNCNCAKGHFGSCPHQRGETGKEV